MAARDCKIKFGSAKSSSEVQNPAGRILKILPNPGRSAKSCHSPGKYDGSEYFFDRNDPTVYKTWSYDVFTSPPLPEPGGTRQNPAVRYWNPTCAARCSLGCPGLCGHPHAPFYWRTSAFENLDAFGKEFPIDSRTPQIDT